MKIRKIYNHLHFGTAYILLIIIGFSWHIGSNYFEEQTGYEEYVESLQEAALMNTPMAKAWVNAGKEAFTDSSHIKLPYSESVYFAPEKPSSQAYKFNCKANQILSLKAHNQANGKVYTELFTKKNNRWEQVAETDTLERLIYQFKEDSECMLRIQPQLLVEAHYSINLFKKHQLSDTIPESNPVALY